MRLEDLRMRELEKQMKKEEEEGKRIVSARLRMLAEIVSQCAFFIQFQQEEINAMQQENLELQKRVVSLQKKRKFTNAEQFILECQDAYYYAASKALRINGLCRELWMLESYGGGCTNGGGKFQDPYGVCVKRPSVLADIMEMLESSGMNMEEVSIAYDEDSQSVFDYVGSEILAKAFSETAFFYFAL